MSYVIPSSFGVDMSGSPAINGILPVYPPTNITVLKADVNAYENAGIETTTGSNQLLFTIPASSFSQTVGSNSSAILSLNADLTVLNSATPSGFRFGVSQTDASGITYLTRDYITDCSSAMMVAAPTMVLIRETDFPVVDASLNVFVAPTGSFAGYDIPSGVTLHYSYALQSP